MAVTLLFIFLVVLASGYCEIHPTNQTRIVGGTKVTRPVPYQISLQVKPRKSFFDILFLTEKGDWTHTCGGSIIGEYHVLTAAHCVDGGKPENFTVLAGTLKRTKGGTRHEVESIKIHHNYKELVTCDIAVIKVKTPFEFNENVQKIEMAEENIEGDVPVVLTGWGYTRPIRFGRLPVDLQELEYKTMTNEQCREEGFNVTETEICTYKGPLRGACAGDSGGPLVNLERNKQIGVVSYGTQICSMGAPDAFTRVSVFIDWVKEQMV